MDYQEKTEIRHRTKKDKRKWCKGKTGIPHDFVYQFSFGRGLMPTNRVLNTYVCSKCDKKQFRDEKYNPDFHNKRQKLVKKDGRDYYEYKIIKK